MSANIIVGGDIVPTDSNRKLFEEKDLDALIGRELKEILRTADFSIFNLEVPLTDTAYPIPKCGPHLIAPTATIAGLKAINPYFFGLANNHIMDQGSAGLKSTLQILDENCVAYAGAGSTLEDVSKPYVLNISNKTVGIYCCVEHEFSVASDNQPGANPFDPLESPDHIAALKEKCDYVIVLYHGGKEHYRYPSPALQKVCRKLVEKGADLVVCQHSHCIGCEEKYRDGIIVYGQGNFLFDHSDSEYWKTGLLIRISVDREIEVSYLPIIKVDEKVRLADSSKAAEILNGFEKRSTEIQADGFVKTRYNQLAKENTNYYLNGLTGRKSIFFRVMNRMFSGKFTTFNFNRKYRQEEILRVENYLQCETHRELLDLILKIKGERTDGS